MKKVALSLILLCILSISIHAQEYKSVNEAKGVAVGMNAPLFTALDADNNQYSLGSALEKGPVVVIFYRGDWCPHCNRHLSGIQDSLQYIHKLGASVIAIAPQKPEYLQNTREKTGSEFTLLYDEEYQISDAYDVKFLPDNKKVRSNGSALLPIPATYVVDNKGKIVWRHFDPNYKNRSTVSEILDALSTISSE